MLMLKLNSHPGPAESGRINKLVMGTFLPDMSMNTPRGIRLRFDAEGAEAGIEFNVARLDSLRK